MVRAKGADSAATIAKIIETAHVLLERDGLDGLTFRGVAREAKLSVGTIGYYFSSREALWSACLDAHYARLEAFAAEHLSRVAELPPTEFIDRVTRSAYEFARQERVMLRLQLEATVQHGFSPERQAFRKVVFSRAARSWTTDTSLRVALNIQTLTFATVRYACASPEERIALTGATSEHQADEIISAHLAECAHKLFGVA